MSTSTQIHLHSTLIPVNYEAKVCELPTCGVLMLRLTVGYEGNPVPSDLSIFGTAEQLENLGKTLIEGVKGITKAEGR